MKEEKVRTEKENESENPDSFLSFMGIAAVVG